MDDNALFITDALSMLERVKFKWILICCQCHSSVLKVTPTILFFCVVNVKANIPSGANFTILRDYSRRLDLLGVSSEEARGAVSPKKKKNGRETVDITKIKQRNVTLKTVAY